MSKKKKAKKVKPSVALFRTFTKEEKECCKIIRETYNDLGDLIDDVILICANQMDEASERVIEEYYRVFKESTILSDYSDAINTLLNNDITDRIRIYKELKERDSELAKVIYDDLLSDTLDITEKKVYKSLSKFITMKATGSLSILRNVLKKAITDSFYIQLDNMKNEYVESMVSAIIDQSVEYDFTVNVRRIYNFTDAYISESLSKRYITSLQEELVNVTIEERYDDLSRRLYKESFSLLKSKFSNTVFDELEQRIAEECKLLSWKDLEKEILSKGFSLIRSNGDHGIYRNPKGEVIVMPRGRDIGKGLQIKIRKQLTGRC